MFALYYTIESYFEIAFEIAVGASRPRLRNFFFQFCLMSHPPVGLLASATAAFASIALADKTGTKVSSIRIMDQITMV